MPHDHDRTVTCRIRYRETTMVYRDEQSGELSGLSRVRAITQDDAHVFCRQSDIESEIKNIWDIVERFYGAFGIELQVRLSSHDPQDMSKYLGDVKKWDEAVAQLRAVIELNERQREYIDGVGEAAFYGPKIDFMGKDVLGREFQASTIQLDFGQPGRLQDLTCTNESWGRRADRDDPLRHRRFAGALLGAADRALRRSLPGVVVAGASAGGAGERLEGDYRLGQGRCEPDANGWLARGARYFNRICRQEDPRSGIIKSALYLGDR